MNWKPIYTKSADRITISGKLVADMPAHSVIVLDDLGQPDDEYWYRSHVARIGADGGFRVTIDKPARASGHFRISFCFENGMITGDGVGVEEGDSGQIRKSYRYGNGGYRFGDR